MVQRLASVLSRIRRLGFVIPALALIVVAVLALLAFPHAGAGVTTASATATTATSAPTTQANIRRFSITGDSGATPTATGGPQATDTPAPGATDTPAPAPTATQPPAPTATPAPSWHTVSTYSGASSQTLITLDSSYQGEQLQLLWTCAYTDALPSWALGANTDNLGGGITCAAQYPTSGVFNLGVDNLASNTISVQDTAGGQWTMTLQVWS